MKEEIKEMCHKCKKYPAEYNQTYCEFCLGISNKDDYITNLQEENERKERLITQYGEGMCAYANRIDKATEYIKSNLDNTGWLEIGSQDVEVLLNILQGKSDE